MASRSENPGGPDQQVVRLSRWHMFLAYLSASYGFGFQNMVAFLIPLRARELDAPLPIIGLIVGIAGVMPALLSVTTGAFADRFGARRTFVLSTFATGIISVLFFLSPSYWGLLALQPFFGFFRSMGWVAAQTYITGVGTPQERAGITGRFSFSANLGPLVSPLIIGAVAQVVGFQTSFLFVSIFAVAYSVIGLALPEIHVKGAAGSGVGFGAALGMLRIRGVKVAMLLTFVRLWLFSGWGPFFQLFLLERGFGPLLMATVISGNSAVTVVVTLFAGRVSRLASKEVVTAVALGLAVLGTVISPYVAVIPLVYLPALLMGTGSGLSLPLLMAIMSDNAPPGSRGVAMGLRTQANQAASMTAPMTTGALVPALGIHVGFLVSALFLWSILGVALLIHLGVWPGKRERAYEHT